MKAIGVSEQVPPPRRSHADEKKIIRSPRAPFSLFSAGAGVVFRCGVEDSFGTERNGTGVRFIYADADTRIHARAWLHGGCGWVHDRWGFDSGGRWG
jgi:hypothetical protein